MDGVPTALLPLRMRFIEMNVARSAELSILRNRLKRDQDPEPSLLEIGDLVHKIAGVAATLGFAEMGRLALELDKLTTCLRLGELRVGQVWSEAEPVLDALIDEIAA